MKIFRRDWWSRSIVATLLAFGTASVFAQDSSVKTFPTYRAAADAFVSAVKAKDNARVERDPGRAGTGSAFVGRSDGR